MEVLLGVLLYAFPKAWFVFVPFMVFFVWAFFKTPNRIVLEDGGDGNTYVYFDELHSREPGHCLVINKDNLVSWDCGDTQEGTMILRYIDSAAQENMALVSLVNTTSAKSFMGKRYRKENIEFIEQERIFNFMNKNRAGAPGYVKPDPLPVWIYKKIKAWLDPVQRAQMKADKAKRKEEWNKKVEEAKVRQAARRAEAAKQREEERARREKEKAKEAKKKEQEKETAKANKKK